MPRITTKDGTQIYYKDWGNGTTRRFQPWLAFERRCLGRPDVFLAAHGYRCIAHDRRGHGRSSQTWKGNDMDTYADDLAELIEALDLATRSTSATPRAAGKSPATSAATAPSASPRQC